MTELLTHPLVSLPLSQNQQVNWFLYQLEPQGLADKVFFALRIKSPVDSDVIKTAVQALINRHPSLRSTYGDRDGQLIQEIHDTVEVNLEEIDASLWSREDLNDQLLQAAKRPFNLEQDSVLRVSFFTRSATDHILLITIHKIACDWESLFILIDEFLTLYDQPETELPLLKQSYKNAVQREINRLNSSQGKKLKTYWQNQLAGELPVLELPTTNSRPPLRTYTGSSYRFEINQELTQQLRQLAQKEGVTTEAILLTAFKVLLYRYTGEEDILVGLRKTQRSQPEFARVIGNCSNVVVARDGISGNRTFTEVLKQVSHTLTEINTYQEYPFPLLVKQFQSPSTFSHSPICQASFSLQTWHHLTTISSLFDATANQKPITCGQLELEYVELPQQNVEFDISLEVIELRESGLGYFKYNSDLLEAATIAQITRHFQNLLAAIVSQPQQPVAQLPMLSDAEQQQILYDWNATQTDYDLSQCLHQLIEAQVEETPNAVAVVVENEQLTYRDLNSRANQLAHYLQKLGVKSEVFVGLCVERSLEMVVGLLAILKAGGAYVPIDPNYPAERIAYMLADSQVPVLLTQEKLVAQLPETQSQIIGIDSHWEKISLESNENLDSGVQPENLAYVIYTSGSTGKPKGAMNTHRGICNRLLWMQEAYQLTSEDRILQKTPFSFDVSVWEFFWTLMTGACLVVAKPGGHQDSSYLVNLIAQQQITTLHFVPSMLQIFLEEKRLERCNSLKRVICSGEVLPFDLQERFFSRLDCELHNLYGPTEAAIDVTYWQCKPESTLRIVPIGRPIGNTQIYILDSLLQPVPIGVAGELYIGGVGVARGYLNRPDLTEEKFIPNLFENSKLYKTGDLARYLPDGTIEYLRRIDYQVKIRGFRIELGELEAVLNQHSTVRDCVVVARTNSVTQQLAAYIVPNDNPPTPTELRQFLKDKLPDYMIPAAFVVLESLPLTPNGKVNRRALPVPDKSSFLENHFVPPRNSIEQQLAQIWSDLLNINPVGVKDNFFELGGHSLLAIKLMAKIQQQFGKTLPLASLFTSPTIEDLANLLQTSTQISFSPLIPIQPKGTKSPFFCIHPAGGHVLCYVKFSRYLGSDQPFYGLQAQGFNEGEEALTTIEEMASLYVKAIREFQPEPPYQVGGWSFGGVVAYEVAQQLHAAGLEVSRLAILDSYVPILLDKKKKIDDVYMVGVLSRVFGGMFGQDNLVAPDELQGLSVKEKIDYIIDKARKVGIFSPDTSREQNQRILDVLVGTLKATYAYKRRPYPGKVTVFRAQQKHIMASDPQLVWVELFSILDAGDIEVIDVPGSHYTFILEPHVPVLAERLGACLS
ncbi:MULTISPECIES: non-ribosomal peptide synthetase [unclassified Coleofasciculus]|uniref:non-ribosomal peptide synthetase n=1 Tax=unclassified Coleofasciculus TaxID=2692782 RepID=UPI0018800C0F|nr:MULTISPECIES: non-ribosomal peptide synthetase [unclassified Coleofasciculus]MBE9128404.1 amino acid adenylation domain-containing protein [Coleofasciculus sp. LEGE 07081]MBE9150358.1 amino acid adenylation domain-containing protein [Coleofasciculus sp. LEGE 07092]